MEGHTMTPKQRNAARQAAYRARQRKLNRKVWSVHVTEEEQFYLERVLLAMREDGITPTSGRDRLGQFRHIDI